MVKQASKLNQIIQRYVQLLSGKIYVQRVLMLNSGEGPARDYGELPLLVISPSFEGMEWGERSDLLAFSGVQVDPTIQGWGFTPRELEQHLSGEQCILFLSTILTGSREVYAAAHAGPGASR